MTDCNSALGPEGVGTNWLSYTYASSLGIVSQAAPTELSSGETTRAYESGGYAAPHPPNAVCLLFLLVSQLKTIYSVWGLLLWAINAERGRESERGVCAKGEENHKHSTPHYWMPKIIPLQRGLNSHSVFVCLIPYCLFWSCLAVAHCHTAVYVRVWCRKRERTSKRGVSLC